MLSCVMDHNKGEPALSISKFAGSKTAALVSDLGSIGQQTIGISGGSGGAFQFPTNFSTMLSAVEAGAAYAFVQTEDVVLGNADTAYSAEFVADKMQGLTLSKRGKKSRAANRAEDSIQSGPGPSEDAVLEAEDQL
jgi:hypothetical protein